MFNGTNYKIGKSTNPERRIKELQSGSDFKIEIISKYYSPKFFNQIETALHNGYSHERLNSEWFDLSLTEVLKFKEDCMKIEKNLKFLNDNKI